MTSLISNVIFVRVRVMDTVYEDETGSGISAKDDDVIFAGTGSNAIYDVIRNLVPVFIHTLFYY